VLLVLAGTAGCGRLAFDETTSGVDGDDAVDDALMVARCGDPVIAPATLRMTGKTFSFGNFQGAISLQTSVAASVRERVSGTVLAMTTSDATTADYSVDIPAGGHAPDAVLVYSRTPDLFTTTVFLDRPLARDLVGDTTVWNPGNGSVWGGAEMAVVYGSGGDGSHSRDSLKGTITFEVRDCVGVPIPNVTLTLTPAPEILLYQSTTGGIDGSRSDTEGTYGSAVAFNAEPGATHVEATGPGFTFDPMDVTVSAGDSMDMVVVRGY
jgi:hypothetical protein